MPAALWSAGKGMGQRIRRFVLPLITCVALGEPLNLVLLQFHCPSNGTGALCLVYQSAVGLRGIDNIRKLIALRKL